MTREETLKALHDRGKQIIEHWRNMIAETKINSKGRTERAHSLDEIMQALVNMGAVNQKHLTPGKSYYCATRDSKELIKVDCLKSQDLEEIYLDIDDTDLAIPMIEVEDFEKTFKEKEEAKTKVEEEDQSTVEQALARYNQAILDLDKINEEKILLVGKYNKVFLEYNKARTFYEKKLKGNKAFEHTKTEEKQDS